MPDTYVRKPAIHNLGERRGKVGAGHAWRSVSLDDIKDETLVQYASIGSSAKSGKIVPIRFPAPWRKRTGAITFR